MYEIPVLSEIKPSSNTNSVLYTPTYYSPPVGGILPQTATGTVFITNQSSADDTVSVALVPSGDTLGPQHWICFKAIVAYGHNIYLQDIHLNFDDSVVINSTNGSSNFIFNGIAYA